MIIIESQRLKREQKGSKMDTSVLMELIEDNESLQVGQKCIVRWTNSGNQYEERAEIVRLNPMSVVVRVVNNRLVIVPRITAFKRWSCNNCVRRENGDGGSDAIMKNNIETSQKHPPIDSNNLLKKA
jgi:hypothetical protein